MNSTIQERIKLLISKVNEDVSYFDSPVLKEIALLTNELIGEDKDTLLFLYDTNIFLADAYTRLCRFSLAAKYHFECVKYAKKLKELYDVNIKDIKEVIYKLLRDRNFYIDDDCEDVKDVINGLISEKDILKLFDDRLSHRRNMKNDPVEMSDEYLSVIDEIEEKIEKNRTMYGMGSCFEVWDLKEQYLAEKGITWKSPALLNPRVRFD